MPLHPIAADLWEICTELKLGPGSWLPVRSVVVRLPDGGLWLHSPVRFTEEDRAAIDALGPVRFLVAPNNFHHLLLPRAQAAWPDAATWVAPGVPAKQPDVRVDGVLGTDAPPWSDTIAQTTFEGAPLVQETVFLHGPSHSLICTDLVFHMRQTRGWFMPLFLRVVGAHDRFAQSRTWRWVFVKDRAAIAPAAHAVSDWPVDRVIPAHGEVLEVDAAHRLRTELRWMREGTAITP